MKKNNIPILFRSFRFIRLIGCLLALAALPLLRAVADTQDIADPEIIASPVAGTIIRVTTTADELNENGNCSLREAVRAANLDAKVDACPAGKGPDEIQIPIGTYTLSIAGKDENNALTGDLDITSNVRVVGQGADLTAIDGNSIDRVFHVIGPGITVEIYNLTIQNGNAADTTLYGGGGILNDNGTLTVSGCVLHDNETVRIGGGVDSTGTLVMVNSTFHDNNAPDGGGLFNGGTAELTGVTFYNNTGTKNGGAFDNYNVATLTNVTISNNTAETGGGIFTDGTLTLLNVTITGNSSGITNRANPGDARAKSTLIADSVGGSANNCTDVGITSEGNNLDSGNSCNFTDTTDQNNTPAQLGPLSDNDGPTLTHMLLAGSPAIDKGNALDCPIFDQRGALRPADGDGNGTKICDIGAVEVNGIFPLLVYLPVVRR